MIFKGNGIKWDNEKNKILCKFLNGEFETDNKRIIEKLKCFDCVSYDNESEVLSDDIKEIVKTRKQLVTEVKELGIKGADRMSRDELLEALK